MLDYLGNWCKKWGLTINFNKSKIMHFRAPSKQSTEYNLKCSSSSVDFIHQYKYLDVLFTEHLDLVQMTKIVAQSASRALRYYLYQKIKLLVACRLNVSHNVTVLQFNQ